MEHSRSFLILNVGAYGNRLFDENGRALGSILLLPLHSITNPFRIIPFT